MLLTKILLINTDLFWRHRVYLKMRPRRLLLNVPPNIGCSLRVSSLLIWVYLCNSLYTLGGLGRGGGWEREDWRDRYNGKQEEGGAYVFMVCSVTFGGITSALFV